MSYIRVIIANQAGSRASRDEKSPRAGTSGIGNFEPSSNPHRNPSYKASPSQSHTYSSDGMIWPRHEVLEDPSKSATLTSSRVYFNDKRRAVLHLRFEHVVKTNVVALVKFATSETFW